MSQITPSRGLLITAGQIHWAAQWSDAKIAAGRHSEEQKTHMYIGRMAELYAMNPRLLRALDDVRTAVLSIKPEKPKTTSVC